MPSLGGFASSVNFVLRPQVQPWHPASLYMTESALAVLALTQDEKVFWQYSSDLFDAEPEYKDNMLLHEGRNETYKRLAALAHKSVGVEEAKLLDLLEVPEDGSRDNKLIKDVKYTIRVSLIKLDRARAERSQYNRTVGVHMTPTVAFDGIQDSSISSSFSADQWLKWLNEKVDKA